ncbi:hypothetical protein [Rubinisphaera margarita]|uniref:hypothetical protein n=1 Tax=Rubinisphaera margarita TaxID=2909586 RepID=UPI001EE9A1E4|nr:hypothetical protein [Rubinisphaera margarita]MCG6155881.1 hypothetical protein [Rubinisphaera margarita]
MPDLKCPHCRAALRVPDSLMGKKLRCKNETCKQTFVAQLEPASPAVQVDDPPMFSDMPPDWQQAMDERKREEERQNERGQSFFDDLGNGSVNEDDLSESRYPNLMKYIRWARVVAIVLIVLTYIGIGFNFLHDVIEVSRLSSSSNETLGATIVLVLVTTISVAVAYLFYVMFMAGIEFMQVIIDIEENTRSRREASE